jgi:hypothetical protein
MKFQRDFVLITKPEYEMPEGIMLTEGAKASLEDKLAEKYMRVTVYAVGEDVKSVKPGDEILCIPRALRSAVNAAEFVTLEGKIRVIVREYDVIAVY